MASSADAKDEGLVFHPMDQFIVEPLFGAGTVHWYTVTNVTLWMALSVVALILIMVIGTSKRALVPSRAQSIGELAYGFVHKMVEDVAGKDAVPYFPYIMTLFMFIVLSNFLGLLPMSFTTTSHIAVTAVMAMVVFLSVTIIGFAKNGMGFLSLFWISSAPLALRPALALIEIISISARAGLKANGADEIQKRDKNPMPFFANPIIVTDKNTTIAMTAVTAIWDVVVKDIGNKPKKFDNTMNIKSVMM